MTIDYSQYKQALETQGFAHIPGFYTAEELAPLKRSMARIIGTLYAHHLGKPLPAGDFNSDTFQRAYMEMIRHDRKLGGVVYDAVKRLPEFLRIVSSEKNIALAQALRASDLIGINRGSSGIRIDYPNEEKFMAPWHQDYPSHMGSIDGMVFWSPLVPITPDIGPLEVCVGSHQAGLMPLYYDEKKLADAAYKSPNGKGYGMLIANEEHYVHSFPHIHATCNDGDMLVVDFLTLHRSGYNRSEFPRWSMQLRYFNFNHEPSMQMGWPGGISQGNRPEKFHPELLAEGTA